MDGRINMNDKKYSYNAKTGEEVITELTNAEQAELDSQREAAIAQRQGKLDAVRLAWETKVGAYQKLGLTTAEIEVIAPMPFELRGDDLKTVLGLGGN